MKLFPKIINGFYSLNIFAKKIILEYASANFSKVAGLQPAVGGVVYICFVLKGVVIATGKFLQPPPPLRIGLYVYYLH